MWSASRTRLSNRVRLVTGLLLAALASAVSAHAVVLQPTPGGITIPVLTASVLDCSDNNVEHCIDGSEGDAALIDVQKDALIAPEAFQPTCTLTFTPIVKGGGDHIAFGWYNLKPDPANPGKFLKPTQAELYGMFLFPFGARTGAQLVGQAAMLDLAKEQAAGRYAGGEIGFFLTGGGDFSQLKLDPTTHALTGITLDRIFYTQHALNPGSSGASTYYQVLTWQSVKFKNAFYFGWEDRQASSNADNDFDDLVFLVTGIQCTGGGEPCDTGKKGVCADGTQQCVKGEIGCVQNIQPSDEKCNALDDDCDGMVDNGDGLCEAGKVCDRGRCVPKCGTGEFRCTAGLVCSDRQVCVEAACAKKDCPVGQVCHNGDCIDSCKGVTCPYAEVCRNGGCVDPCDGVQCDDGYSCVLGVCRSCACTSCEGTQVCSKDNVCVDSGCENQTCMAGAHCAMGTCVDDCAGTKCPQGQLCDMGACVADPNAQIGGSSSVGGSEGNGGNIPIITGGTSTKPSTGGSGGSIDATGGTSTGGTDMLSSDDGAGAAKGCGCSIPAGRGGVGALAGLLFIGALGLRRRRA
jgi:MYXO-CTERM domain-containing protein